MTKKQVVKLIRSGQGEMSLRQYAEELEISPAYLSEIYSGERNPGDKILERFKVSRIFVPVYFRTE